MEVKPRVQEFPVTACWGMWGTGPMVYEYGFHTFSNSSNCGYLKHEKNWSEDRIGHRIHGQTEELEWGKIGTRENSGDPGSKTNGQTHRGTLCHSVHNPNSRERAFECPSLGHMLTPCIEEEEHWSPASTRAVSIEGMGIQLPGEGGVDLGQTKRQSLYSVTESL